MRIRVLTVVVIGMLAIVAFGTFAYFSSPWISPQERLAEFVRLNKLDTTAQDALTQFFAALHDKRYAEAVEMYGGDYDTLRDWNPSVDPNDYAELWRNGCEMNGLNCLAVNATEVGGRSPDGSYVINAWFTEANGNGFSILENKGGGENEVPSRRNVFRFKIIKSSDGASRVQTMPVYTP